MSDGYCNSKKTDTICEYVCGQVYFWGFSFLFPSIFSSDPLLILIQGLEVYYS